MVSCPPCTGDAPLIRGGSLFCRGRVAEALPPLSHRKRGLRIPILWWVSGRGAVEGLPTPVSLRKHQQINSGEKPFYCIDWKTDFREKSKLRNHQRTHTARGKIHACDVCDKSFSEPSGLKRHRLKHKEEKAFLCKHCSKYFSDSNLQSHHTEDRPVSCDKCETLFKTKAEVQAHQIVHIQVKLFKFRHCKLTSKRLSELKILRGIKEFILVKNVHSLLSKLVIFRKHLLVHTDKGPIPCNDCGKHFKQN